MHQIPLYFPPVSFSWAAGIFPDGIWILYCLLRVHPGADSRSPLGSWPSAFSPPNQCTFLLLCGMQMQTEFPSFMRKFDMSRPVAMGPLSRVCIHLGHQTAEPAENTPSRASGCAQLENLWSFTRLGPGSLNAQSHRSLRCRPTETELCTNRSGFTVQNETTVRNSIGPGSHWRCHALRHLRMSGHRLDHG